MGGNGWSNGHDHGVLTNAKDAKPVLLRRMLSLVSTVSINSQIPRSVDKVQDFLN